MYFRVTRNYIVSSFSSKVITHIALARLLKFHCIRRELSS